MATKTTTSNSQFRASFVQALKTVNEGYQVAFRQILNEEAKTLVDTLKAKSPVGATGQLKNGWKIVPARRQRNQLTVQVSVDNTSQNSINRIAGRPPGRMPPSNALVPWVRAKLGISGSRARGVAYVIARAIGKRGTKRYQSGENVLGLNRKTNTYNRNSPVIKAQFRIIGRINQLAQRSKKGR